MTKIVPLLIEEDISSLKQLYIQVFKKKISSNEIRWRFTENPEIEDGFNGNIIAKMGNKILGHTAIMPTNLTINNNHSIKAGLTVASMVSEKSPGLFFYLLRYMIKYLKDNNFDLIYGFPNKNSFPYLKNLFGFEEGFFNYLQIKQTLPLMK